jgi:hypothetical protein
MRSRSFVVALAMVVACQVPGAEDVRRRDLEEALAAFRSNVAAIHRRDVEAYISHYLESPDLVVAGADSLRRGFELFAAARRASSDWPDTLMAGDPSLAWLAPGVVYGAYPYTVVEGGDSASGWSERVLVKTRGVWKVAVTSRIDRCGCQ